MLSLGHLHSVCLVLKQLALAVMTTSVKFLSFYKQITTVWSILMEKLAQMMTKLAEVTQMCLCRHIVHHISLGTKKL